MDGGVCGGAKGGTGEHEGYRDAMFLLAHPVAFFLLDVNSSNEQ